MEIADVHVRAGAVLKLHGAPVVLAGLLLIAILEIEVSDQQVEHGVVWDDVDQLLHAAKSVGLIATLVAGNGGHDHGAVDAGDPVGCQIQQ